MFVLRNYRFFFLFTNAGKKNNKLKERRAYRGHGILPDWLSASSRFVLSYYYYGRVIEVYNINIII